MKSLFYRINEWFTHELVLEIDRLFSWVKVSIEWDRRLGVYYLTLTGEEGTRGFCLSFNDASVLCCYVDLWGEEHSVKADIDDCTEILNFVEKRGKCLDTQPKE